MVDEEEFTKRRPQSKVTQSAATLKQERERIMQQTPSCLVGLPTQVDLDAVTNSLDLNNDDDEEVMTSGEGRKRLIKEETGEESPGKRRMFGEEEETEGEAGGISKLVEFCSKGINSQLSQSQVQVKLEPQDDEPVMQVNSGDDDDMQDQDSPDNEITMETKALYDDEDSLGEEHQNDRTPGDGKEAERGWMLELSCFPSLYTGTSADRVMQSSAEDLVPVGQSACVEGTETLTTQMNKTPSSTSIDSNLDWKEEHAHVEYLNGFELQGTSLGRNSGRNIGDRSDLYARKRTVERDRQRRRRARLSPEDKAAIRDKERLRSASRRMNETLAQKTKRLSQQRTRQAYVRQLRKVQRVGKFKMTLYSEHMEK